MKRNQCQIAIGMLLLAASTTVGAITINLDYTQDGGFFADNSRRVIMDAAAAFFESRLTDDFDAITSGGVNQMTAIYTNPATGATSSINNFSIAADTITVFVGGRSFTGSTLGRGGPGDYDISRFSDQAFRNTVQRRGEPGEVRGASATEFSLWGGSISFDTGSSWYFDSDLSSDEGFSGSDFYSVALHELGHVLGLGIADSWDNLINGSNEFIGTSAVATNGGSVALEDNGAHWLNGTSSFVDGVSREAAMDPSISRGTRKHFTDLDLAALDDIGWDVAPVPLPPALLLFASGVLGIFGLGRRNRQQCT